MSWISKQTMSKLRMNYQQNQLWKKKVLLPEKYINTTGRMGTKVTKCHRWQVMIICNKDVNLLVKTSAWSTPTRNTEYLEIFNLYWAPTKGQKVILLQISVTLVIVKSQVSTASLTTSRVTTCRSFLPINSTTIDSIIDMSQME